MTTPDPKPGRTAGLEAGGVPPGETPQGEDSTSGIAHQDPPELRKGWGPAALALILLVAALVVVGLVAMAVALAM